MSEAGDTTTTTVLAGTDLEVFCVVRAYADVVQVTLNCHRVCDRAAAAAFGCWAHAQASTAAARTFDTETVLGGGCACAECAELLARVLCERAAALRQRATDVLVSLALPRGARTLDMALLRQLAAVATAQLRASAPAEQVV